MAYLDPTKPHGGQASPVIPKRKRTVDAKGNPLPGSPGWKAYTADRWAAHHQDQIAAAAMPKPPNPKQLAAEANKAAWTSIANMMKALPTQTETLAPYNAQVEAIKPMIDAHHDWLLKAGEYQQAMVNGISQLVSREGDAANADSAGGAALAGAPLGAMPPAGTLSNEKLAAPAISFGGGTANYLRALAPYANAQGNENIGAVQSASADALKAWFKARQEVAGQFPDLQQKYLESMTTTALDNYKGELAGLTAGQKGDSDAAALADKTRHEIAMEEIALKNAQNGEERNRISLRIAQLKKTIPKDYSQSDRTRLADFLKQADAVYNQKHTKKGYGRYQATVKLVTAPAFSGQGKVEKVLVLDGPDEQTVRNRIEYWKKHGGKIEGERQSQQIGGIVPVGAQVDTGAWGEDRRRQAAWQKLVQLNSTLATPLSTSALQNLWRTTHPKA